MPQAVAVVATLAVVAVELTQPLLMLRAAAEARASPLVP
jgi:hypothetical protein